MEIHSVVWHSMNYYCGVYSRDMFLSPEDGGTFVGEDGLVVMAGAESLERYQTHGFHV